jgi:hypothetical protein
VNENVEIVNLSFTTIKTQNNLILLLMAASFYKLGDIGKVEMYSISNTGFICYNDLVNLLKNDGGMFGSPPVNPRTNIKGGVLGYFQASSIVSESILIEK